MKFIIALSTSMVLLVTLAACNGLTPDFQATLTSQAGGIYPTISARLSETPRTPGSAQPAAAVNTMVAQATPAAIEAAQSPALPCDRAAGGNPIDITIPDGSVFQPGEEFTKTWRLVNAGSCAWTEDYAVVWFSGDDLGIVHEHFLNTRVEPGQAIDLSVDMQAPAEQRAFNSYWKLRNTGGELFGLGPGGESPFWVMITVEPASTLTPTISPTPEATPNTFSSGVVTLLLGEGLDMDGAEKSADDSADLSFDSLPDAALAPLNGSSLVVFGDRLPLVDDCREVSAVEPLTVETMEEGLYLCYLSNQGLPGYLRLLASGSTDEITLEFHTWAVP